MENNKTLREMYPEEFERNKKNFSISMLEANENSGETKGIITVSKETKIVFNISKGEGDGKIITFREEGIPNTTDFLFI
jgi:DnaJ-class molecular chaperone